MKATGSLRVKRGIYQIVIDYVDAKGQRRQKSESTGLTEKGNKRRAQAILDQRLQELERESEAALEARDQLFLSFMRSWLDEVVSHRVKANTLTQYNMVFDKYISAYKPFVGVTLHDLTPALLQSYYNTQLAAGLSPNTIRKHHANIHRCLAYAVRLDLMLYNPADRVELPKKKRYQGAQALTPAQLGEVLKAFEGDMLETVVRIAVTYGLRRSEVCGLAWDAVDFEAGTLHVCRTAMVNQGVVTYCDSTKTASSNRVLPLTPSIRDYLLKVKADQEEQRRLFGGAYIDSGLVCVKANGEPIHPNLVTHHFRLVLKKHGLPLVRFHDLRHSAVYALRKGGADAKDIQAWVGHSDVSTTLGVYGHILGNDLTRLGAVMDKVLFDQGQAS